MFWGSKKSRMPSPDEALPGRSTPIRVGDTHFVNGHRITPPFPEGMQRAMFGMGCFWGAERKFWEVPGVYSTAVGYAAGTTPNPTYEEVCSGMTGHNEVVLVVFDPSSQRSRAAARPGEVGACDPKVTYEQLLVVFWENHDPTQGMRQGNDAGTQYRSGIYTFDDAQAKAAEASRELYQAGLSKAGHGAITTEIKAAPDFYYAEDYHQQYLGKNPRGYCGLGGTGVSCPIGVAR